MTEHLYATDPDHPSPPGGTNSSRSTGHEAGHDAGHDAGPYADHRRHDPGGHSPGPVAVHSGAAQPPAHYPWSVDARQDSALARQGGFLRLLFGGLRAALLMPVKPGTVYPGAGSCLALVVFITLLGIAGEWWLIADAADQFNWGALRAAWFDLPIILLGGAWLAQPRGPRLFSRNRAPLPGITSTPLLHFAAVMLAASAWIVAIAYGLLVAVADGVVPGMLGALIGSWVYLAVPLWSYLVAVRIIAVMNRSAPIPILRRFVVLILLAATTAWTLAVPLDPYWETPEGAEPTSYVTSEEIMELQAKLLSAQLAQIRPSRDGVTDLYFIGFAPYAGEDVFRKELDVIQPLMDQRFDTAGRSLRMVNNDRTLRQYPIATVSNLRRVLATIATRMDIRDDVLVLYVTTHGSKNAVLAVELPPLGLHNIDPATLKALLDEAGIRNRVLIISACYSGAFVAPLSNADTLIMTASIADRPSFGCGAESDFTYFGDAIFNHALRQTVSFEEGFALALPRIQQREQAEGFEASQPQIAAGDAIRELLAGVEKRLASSQ